MTMTNLTTNDAAAALQILADAAIQRDTALSVFHDSSIAPESDDENDSPCPIFDAFYRSGGWRSISDMNNFSLQEFNYIWDSLATHVTTNWNVGRGRRSTQRPKDVLFMLLTVIKHGGNWDSLGQMFKSKGPTFEKLVIGYLKVVWDELFTLFVEKAEEKFSMKKLTEQGNVFSNFHYARYATDVTFHQTNRPSGNLQEAKGYYSGKHKLYWFKREVSVLPNGLAIGCSEHHPAAVADIEIFYRNISFHSNALRKSQEERHGPDTGLLGDKYRRHWAVLTDKGYQGAEEYARVVHPRKKPAHRMVTVDDVAFNRDVASDRIIVENYFGRMCSLWAILAHKYRWNERSYDMIFRFCLALTNYHVRLNPLRRDDSDFYETVRNKLYTIGEEGLKKRRRAQERYRQRRRQRMDVRFKNMNGSDEETEAPFGA